MECGGIIVVDDDVDIRETICQVLEGEGYDAYPARNGREALDELQRLKHPCLILLDLMMPVMNGWEFLEARKNIDSFGEIPVVVQTASEERPRAGSVVGTMKKPVDLDALLKTVQRYCGVAEPRGRVA